MSEGSKVKSRRQIIGIAVILLITYHLVLLTLSGFAGHGSLFWISYGFMGGAFAVCTAEGILLSGQYDHPRDLILGYPILYHSAVYFILELIVSSVFIILDSERISWRIGFTVQLLVLAVHLVFAISCFMAKNVISSREQKTKEKVLYIRMAQMDAEMLSSKITDKNIKTKGMKLAEALRYSDPMSNELLKELEQKLMAEIQEAAACADSGDEKEAEKHISRAMMLLEERNKKCKILK